MYSIESLSRKAWKGEDNPESRGEEMISELETDRAPRSSKEGGSRAMTHRHHGRCWTSHDARARLDPNPKNSNRPQGIAQGISVATVELGEESGLLSVGFESETSPTELALDTWSPACSAVSRDCGILRRWCLAGGWVTR